MQWPWVRVRVRVSVGQNFTAGYTLYNSACIYCVNRSLQMTIAGRCELENTLGSQNEALPRQILHLINNILENECFML